MILVTMALYQATDFSGYSASYAVPAGATHSLFTGSVDIILWTGITQQVFDALSTAIKCSHYMESFNLYSLSPNEDIIVINLRSKLLILENTYINQKMMNSYVFTYHGGETRAIHRSISEMASSTDALQGVGFRCVGPPQVIDVNPNLETDRADKDRPSIQVVDYLYKSPTLNHTNLKDDNPMIIRAVQAKRMTNETYYCLLPLCCLINSI